MQLCFNPFTGKTYERRHQSNAYADYIVDDWLKAIHIYMNKFHIEVSFLLPFIPSIKINNTHVRFSLEHQPGTRLIDYDEYIEYDESGEVVTNFALKPWLASPELLNLLQEVYPEFKYEDAYRRFHNNVSSFFDRELLQKYTNLYYPARWLLYCLSFPVDKTDTRNIMDVYPEKCGQAAKLCLNYFYLHQSNKPTGVEIVKLFKNQITYLTGEHNNG
jgi:hypothetical protein